MFCLCGKGMTFHNQYILLAYHCTSSDRFSLALLALRAHPASADPLSFSLSPHRSAPGADRSGHGDAEPAGSSHRPFRVFNVYICSARLPPCACSLACYSSKGIFQPQSTSRPPTAPAHTPAPACTPSPYAVSGCIAIQASDCV